MKTKSLSRSTLYFTQLSLMVALTILIAFVGTVMLPGGLKITFATVPVAVAAIVLGPLGGFVCGTTFGVCSLIQGITGMSALTSALILINPFYGFLLCVVARMLCGTIPAFIFKGLQKTRAKKLSYLIASLSCPVLNTVFFMGIIVTLYWNTDAVQNIASGLGTTSPLLFIVLLVGVQGAIEAVVCAILGTAISGVLCKYVVKRPVKANAANT